MGKYVSVKKRGSQYVVRIEKMPNSYRGYSIYFENDWGCTNLLSCDNFAGEDARLTSAIVQDIKAGGVFVIRFDKVESKLVKASYTMTLKDTPWVRENIDAIKSQLFDQEVKNLLAIRSREYNKAIETAVASDNPTGLIKRMIAENASKLSAKNVLEIERELMKVKTQLVNNSTKQSGTNK